MSLIKGKQIAGSSLPLSKLETQTTQHILVGDASGDLQSVPLSGDATLATNGAITLSNNAVVSTKIANGSVTFDKVNGSALSADLSVSAAATEIARADAAKAYADARYTAATQYADSVAQGLDVKASVKAATTAAITLASDLENGDSIDGIALVTGDRVLVKDQANATENGIYIVAASGAPSRASDADQGDLTGGAFVFVEQGTTNADNGFVCTTDGTPTLGTNDVVFSQFSGASSVTAGDGLTKTGSQLDLSLNSLTAGIVIDPNADKIAFVDASNNNLNRLNTISHLITRISGDGTAAANGILSAARLSSSDQFSSASATTNDGDTSGITISNTPEGMVQVFVNGVLAELSHLKTKDCYFSADGGTTARALNAIASADTLYWNGSVAGYQLEATDKITLVYETA